MYNDFVNHTCHLFLFYLCSYFGPGDVCFSLNGTTYQNNSIVNLEDIGEGDDDALLCKTDFTHCCQPSLGNWYFPNGTTVPGVNVTSGEQWDFYSDRGHMLIRLNRRRNGVEGIYRCEIPHSLNVNQTIYIGVYNTSTGE